MYRLSTAIPTRCDIDVSARNVTRKPEILQVVLILAGASVNVLVIVVVVIAAVVVVVAVVVEH